MAALKVIIAAHERLESESENFWLTQWLRKELSSFRTTLDSVKAKREDS